jgi:hypothetical protein
MPIIRRGRPVRNKNVVNVHEHDDDNDDDDGDDDDDDERGFTRRQAEGKASNKIKANAGSADVIDTLAPLRPS